jgi:hypothetical protein
VAFNRRCPGGYILGQVDFGHAFSKVKPGMTLSEAEEMLGQEHPYTPGASLGRKSTTFHSKPRLWRQAQTLWVNAPFRSSQIDCVAIEESGPDTRTLLDVEGEGR